MGQGADWMSLYGYDRKTTPNLEALASEGVVFERAYSNATWTKLSNPSFLTSLYPTALGYFSFDYPTVSRKVSSPWLIISGRPVT